MLAHNRTKKSVTQMKKAALGGLRSG
jgi:hypothetical protein